MTQAQRDHDEIGERMTRLEGVVSNLAGTVQSMLDSQKQRSGSMLSNVIAVFSFGAVLVGGIFFSLSSRLEIISKDAQIEMLRYVQPVVVSAEQSRSDRNSIHQKVDENTVQISDLAGKVASHYAEWRSSAAEVEAQFKGVGNVQNLRQAELQRLIGMLWERNYKQELPEIQFFPSSHREIIPQ